MATTTIKEGDIIPDVALTYVPYNPDAPDACGMPVEFDLHKEFANKKVILFGVPGAFTPTCSESHLPGYLTYYTQLVDKGVQKIICVSTNDAFVMHAWGRENKVSDKIVMVSDFDYKLGQALGLMNDNNRRLKRFAVVIDNLKVTHLGVEPARGVTVSGAEYLLSKL